MDQAQSEQMVKRLRVSRLAGSDELLNFWREHGWTWATAEASYDDLSRIAEIAEKASVLSSADAESLVVSELQAVWHGGFAKGSSGFAWDDMGDQLPASALLAFVQGVEGAWNEVRDKI